MKAVNIIGAGLSGLTAAITLARSGCACNLISVQPSERAQSVLAEGGINGSLNTMGEEDTVEEHYADTMRGGCQLADPEAVKGLTEGAPELIHWLAELGVPFHQNGGHILQRNFGGQKKKRTAYAKSSTGKVMVSALIDEARKYEVQGYIRRYPHHSFIRLLFHENGKLAGVRIKDTYTGHLYDCYGYVLLASGGMSGMFPGMTTGTVMNTGDVTAIAFSQGVRLSNLEMLQYHPTTIGISGKRLLVTEAARGEGGRLCIKRNGDWWYFMEELYPELKNLMPRDVVSREMYRVARLPECEGPVCLDLTGLTKEIWNTKLPDMREELKYYLNLDPAKEFIPVEPGIHYFMGGIDVDTNHRTNIDGLYASGECCSQYHGANRLGGNSLLGAVYGGKRAAEDILLRIQETSFDDVNTEGTATLMHGKEVHGNAMAEKEPGAEAKNPQRSKTSELNSIVLVTEGEKAPPHCVRRHIGRCNRSSSLQQDYDCEADSRFVAKEMEILLEGLGIVRKESTITKALDRLHELEEEVTNVREECRLSLGRAMLEAALYRKESRGAHTREDYPERNEACGKMILAELSGEEITLGWKENKS